jgi:hypothetical protein
MSVAGGVEVQPGTALHKKASGPVRASGRPIIAQRFIAGERARSDEVREADD